MHTRILLVESDANAGDFVRGWFEEQRPNAILEFAFDGEQALDLVFARGAYATRRPDQTPQLMLLEVELPGMNGLEVLKCIRGSERTRRIPVVLMTRGRDAGLIERAYELGANSVIVKPATGSRPEDHPICAYWALHNVAPEP